MGGLAFSVGLIAELSEFLVKGFTMDDESLPTGIFLQAKLTTLSRHSLKMRWSALNLGTPGRRAKCHRGGANDEITWRGILEYFAPAVQLGLGVEIPMALTVGPVTQSPGRYRFASVLGKRLLYGAVSNLGPGQTATFKFTVSAKNSGKYDFRSYARESYTTTDTFACGTLTVR